MPKGGNGGSGSGGGGGAIRGNKRDNVLDGTPEADIIEGLGGNDTLNGFDGDDSLDGGDGADILFGGAGNDTLLGGSGDDSLGGNAGDDQIDGGDGIDEVGFAGNRDDYDVTWIDATTVVISGPDGTDTVTNVESFRFDDMTQSFDEVILPRDPNVLATGVTLSDTSVVQGGGLIVDWQIASDGVIDAGSSSSHLVIATAPDIGAALDTFGDVATGTLATGTTTGFSANLDTASLAPGTYWIAAVADTGDALAESDETDNLSDWIQIEILPQVTDFAMDGVEVLPTSDLNLNTAYSDPVPGGTLDLRYSISNQGNTGPTQFTVQTFLSRDAILSADDLDVDYQNYTVALGETGTFDATIPLSEFFPNGDWYVISVIAPDNPYGGPPDDESDNIAVTATPITLTGGWVYGTDASEVFEGQAIHAVYDAQGGDDTLLAVTASDYFKGGAGLDTADYSALGTGVAIEGVVSGTETYAIVQENDPLGPDPTVQMGALEDVERLIGTGQDDIFIMAEFSVNYLDGGGGNDTLLGSFGNDEILGGSGDDQIGGLFGDDLIVTGDGMDFVFVDREPDGLGGFEGHNHDVVTDFDPLMDVLFVEYDGVMETYDPFADLTQVANGTLLSYAADSSILLLGVDIAAMDEFNLFAYSEDVVAV
jgi:Ca2+-binding RTX toxin-like protein